MENASKALLIAGGVLLALMVIGMLLLMFNNLSSYQDTEVQNEREAQVIEFNKQYTTYDRNDVRGSDVYSLINKIIDYNRRKTVVIAKSTDEGSQIQYEPMKLTFTFDPKKVTFDGGSSKIFGNTNEFTIENQKTGDDFQKKLKIEFDFTNENGIQNLAKGISNLYGIGDSPNEKQKANAIQLWNNNVTKETVSDFSVLHTKLETYKETIYKYYEIMQFKRLHFNCTETKYNDKTGRIIYMKFESNGKIE